MDTKQERARKGPHYRPQFPNGRDPPPSPPAARRSPILSWTAFSVGVNFALLSLMFAQPASRLPDAEHLNGTSHVDRDLCLPRPRLSSFASAHLHLCSGNGHYVEDDHVVGACHCHACFSGVRCENLDPGCHLNLFHGDPTLFEEYWLTQPDAPTVIPSWQGMSYFAHRSNQYLFVDYFLERAIRKLHAMVGNAITEGRYVVLGVGSTQLYQAALYALASPHAPTPTPVVSALPHYSSFEGCTKFLDSRKYTWVGDAEKFKRSGEAKDQPYIELVTSPNNPCGSMNRPVVNGVNGSVVNDLAYYWPHYTAITAPADHPIMLWTLSKITGHAGTRLGWAVVEDASVAARMAYFVQLNTLGLSQDAQARGTTLLRAIMSSYEVEGVEPERRPFFHYGQGVLEDRWSRMRHALDNSSRFELPKYEPSFCSFLGKHFPANPAFLWLKCTKAEEDCQQLLLENKIIARGGTAFGVSTQYVRVSMLDRHSLFNLLLARLTSLN